jgi:hypothetical protein
VIAITALAADFSPFETTELRVMTYDDAASLGGNAVIFADWIAIALLVFCLVWGMGHGFSNASS